MFFGKHISGGPLLVVFIATVLASAGADCSKAGNAVPPGRVERTEIKETNAMIEENNINESAGNDAEFSASVKVGKDKLNVSYDLTNRTKEDIYVLDIFPNYDLETMKPSVNLNNTVTVWSEPDGVRLVRGLPPYPQEKDMSAFYTPYTSKVGPGETLKRRLELPLPLVEFSPYYSPLETAKYEAVDVTRIRLTVNFIKSSAEGLEAKEVEFAKGVFFVKSKFLIRDTRQVDKEFTTGPIRLLKYPETFTRTF